MKRTIGTLYETIGDRETCQRLSECFHARIADDPILKAVFPKNLNAATERLTLFLAERFGGPSDYTARRGKTSLLCRHAHLPIGPAEVTAWLDQMFAAMDELGIPEPARQLLRDYFTETATTVSDPFIHLYQLPLDELKVLLEQNTALAVTCEAGRSLLCEAAGRWDLERVRLLLEYGGDVHIIDRMSYTPLHRAAGAFRPQPESEGRAVAELLLKYGANVNVQSDPGRMTPLHLTARRGNVAIAEVLLKSGAEIEAGDRTGETPLRRAVNCVQEAMMCLLLSYGANPLSEDKKGQTVLAAARLEPIRRALREATGG